MGVLGHIYISFRKLNFYGKRRINIISLVALAFEKKYGYHQLNKISFTVDDLLSTEKTYSYHN